MFAKRPSGSIVRGHLRAAIDARDGRRCAICGAEENIVRHHVVPWIEGGGTNMYNILTLCKTHEDMAHADILGRDMLRGIIEERQRAREGRRSM